METIITVIGGLLNMLIPALVFLFLNDMIFLSKYNGSNDRKTKWLRTKKLIRLVPVSPIGLFIALALVLVLVETTISAFLVGMGAAHYSSDSAIILSFNESGINIDTHADPDAMLILIVSAIAVAVPVLLLIIKRYCKIVGCTHGLGVFIYMAVLFMYITSTLISLPIQSFSVTIAGIVSTVSFIVLLLCFYIPYKDKIEFMRQKESSGLLDQINLLPSINFTLLIILLGMEFMLIKNDYLDISYYFVILAFAILLYVSAQISYGNLFRHIEERHHIIEDNNRIIELSRESQEAQEQVTLAFAEITEAKSGQTGQHVKRVSEYTRVIAEGMDLPPKYINDLRVASMMHDIGKLLIPPEILEKPGRLTDEEFKIMKSHVTIGENLLHNAPGEIMGMARVIAQQHHEWWNGKGYLGMSGEEIELPARICAVADVYDALTSARSYKKAWTADEAFKMITDEVGTHFEPSVVWAFAQHFDEIKEVQERYKDETATYNF